ncbi:TPA: hypothetical protein ACH3X3_004848 [Trebouxia sp. C0006]
MLLKLLIACRFISFEAIKAAHLSAQSCDPLVHHSCVEEVHMRKHSSEKAHTTKLRVELDFSLKDWDEGTLDDMGCYTPQSDIYQVGVMLLKSRRLSAAGMSFAQKLKSKTMDAAEDPYLQTLAPMC